MTLRKSEFSEERFFTPPKLAPLNLDLAALDGGGWAPAQFEGETHDGKRVYCRYRGGYLSVTIAGVDALPSVRVGPPLHGGMTLGQLCRLAGITINGEWPPLESYDMMRREGCKDLSGAKTFYDVWHRCTLDTQTNFLAAALRLPGATLMQRVASPDCEVESYKACPGLEDLVSDYPCLLLGETSEDAVTRVTPIRLAELNAERVVVVTINTCGFQWRVPKLGNDDAKRIYDTLGKTIAVAGQDEGCLYFHFAMHAQMDQGSTGQRIAVERLDRLLDQFFPMYQLFSYDLVSGEPENISAFFHLDPRIVEWIDAEPDRWLSIHNVGGADNPRFVGVRAGPAPSNRG